MPPMISIVHHTIQCIWSLVALFSICTAAPQPIVTQPLAPPVTNPLDRSIPTKLISGRQEIPVCTTLPLSGEISILGNQVLDGMSLFFNKVQRESNPPPFFYSLKALDDQADVKLSRTNINQLLQQTQSPLFLSILNTDTVESTLYHITDKTILSLFPLEGALQFRKQEYKNLIYFRANYDDEIRALVHYTAKTLNKKKIALFYEESAWGLAGLESVKRILAEYKLPLAIAISYPQRTLRVAYAAKKIARKAPTAIICIAHARPAYNFIQQIINQGLYTTAILGLSSLFSIQSTLKKSRGANIIIASVVPDPTKSQLPIAQEYRADMQKYTPFKTLSPFSFEGYINAALLVECTKLVPFPLTMGKLINVIEGLKNVNFKGLTLNFANHSLSQNVWLNTGDEREWFLSPTTTKQQEKIQINTGKS